MKSYYHTQLQTYMAVPRLSNNAYFQGSNEASARIATAASKSAQVTLALLETMHITAWDSLPISQWANFDISPSELSELVTKLLEAQGYIPGLSYFQVKMVLLIFLWWTLKF